MLAKVRRVVFHQDQGARFGRRRRKQKSGRKWYECFGHPFPLGAGGFDGNGIAVRIKQVHGE